MQLTLERVIGLAFVHPGETLVDPLCHGALPLRPDATHSDQDFLSDSMPVAWRESR